MIETYSGRPTLRDIWQSLSPPQCGVLAYALGSLWSGASAFSFLVFLVALLMWVSP